MSDTRQNGDPRRRCRSFQPGPVRRGFSENPMANRSGNDRSRTRLCETEGSYRQRRDRCHRARTAPRWRADGPPHGRNRWTDVTDSARRVVSRRPRPDGSPGPGPARISVIPAGDVAQGLLQEGATVVLADLSILADRPGQTTIRASGCCIAGLFRNTRECRRWFAPKPPSAPGAPVTIAQGLAFPTLDPTGHEPISGGS